MSSAFYFNLDQSKILSSGNGLKDFNIQIASLWEKVKLLILSNSIFSLNVFLHLSFFLECVKMSIYGEKG